MPCRHIVKYMILALAFGSCLTYTQATALADGIRRITFYAYS